MRKRVSSRPQKKFYSINHSIRVPTVRVLDERGEQRGILDTQEALAMAAEEGVDLVLVAEKAKPPVAKIIDFKKFLYQQTKKEKLAKKGVKKSTTKDVQLSLFIGQQDFERFVSRAQDFLEEGYQVRVKVPLRGRQMHKKPMAFDLINRFIAQVGVASVSHEAKIQGRVVLAVISRSKEHAKNSENKEKNPQGSTEAVQTD